MESEPAVEFRGVVKRYGDVTALDGADFTIARGQTVALLGPNGAGKTTAIDILLGLRTPGDGTVRVLGGTPRHAVADGRVGAMLQSSGLPEHAKVAEVVDLGRRLYGRRRALDDLLALTGLTAVAGQQATRLSGGQTRRVHVALALAGDPELVFLDEPTVALDVEGRRDFWAAMRKVAEAGCTVLFATHYLEEADTNADRVIVLSDGRVRADGPPSRIKAGAGVKTVRFAVAEPDPAALRALPGVTGADVRGERVSLTTADADATLPALYGSGLRIKDIEVAGGGLESALLSLTGDAAAHGEGAAR
ncbi:MAG TPA: ABC transporter ATP-binding protein [Streptosporangiaceae bacterium]|jgi:ABC-2 type transport system ATP-binding protein